MIPHINRIPQKPGRVLLTPVAGEANKYNLTRADEPLADGTPINKEMLDELLAASGVTTGSSVALLLAQEGYQLGNGYMARIKLHTEINGANAPTLNINGTGAKPIVTAGGYEFGTINAGAWVVAIYDEERDAYVIAETSEIINLPHGAITFDDYIPFFDIAGNRSARMSLSDLLQITTGAVGVKKEIDRFTESGTWVCPENVTYIDAWLVGGGGAGGKNGRGGGGGYCHLVREIPVVPGQEYDIVIGAGGSNDGDGGTTSAFGYEALGGQSGSNGGNGGNGGGGCGYFSSSAQARGGNGGSRGGDGETPLVGDIGSSTSGGSGGTESTTNPYDGIDYAGGGGGRGYNGTSTSSAVYGGGNGGGSFGGRPGEKGGNGGGSAPSGKYGGGGGGSYGGGGGAGSSTDGYGGGDGIVIIYASVIATDISALPRWEGGRF